MLSENEARDVALNHRKASRKPTEPELSIDWARVRVKEGILIAPYNATRFLQTRDPVDQLLDCWPILVNMSTGEVRFGKLAECEFWRNS